MFILPNKVVKEFERKCCSSPWAGSSVNSSNAKVALAKVTLPKQEEGWE